MAMPRTGTLFRLAAPLLLAGGLFPATEAMAAPPAAVLACSPARGEAAVVLLSAPQPQRLAPPPAFSIPPRAATAFFPCDRGKAQRVRVRPGWIGLGPVR